MEPLRRRLARALEDGQYRGRLALSLSRTWEKRSRASRPLVLPDAKVIGVGGATLGGSAKTPVVAELALRLMREGARVAVVASSYRARTPPAVRVLSHHAVTHVGDEALMLARTYPELSVFVGRNRPRALELAARQADIVVVDALVQTAPRRLDLSVLVLGGDAPWGSGKCPPAGDLRVRRDRLLRVCDVLLYEVPPPELEQLAFPAHRFQFSTKLGECVHSPDGQRVPLVDLKGRRLGLVTTLARPARVLAKLQQAGLDVARQVAFSDHGRPSRQLPRDPGIDGWLMTPKCFTNLAQLSKNTPVWVLELETHLPDALVELVRHKGWIPGG